MARNHAADADLNPYPQNPYDNYNDEVDQNTLRAIPSAADQVAQTHAANSDSRPDAVHQEPLDSDHRKVERHDIRMLPQHARGGLRVSLEQRASYSHSQEDADKHHRMPDGGN